MSEPLDAQFDQHQIWCVGFSRRLSALAEWLEQNGLADASVYTEVNRLRFQLSSQQVMVAVIAEFSRGKSELINALFFAHYGRRIMPAGAGRTTMCPAEIGWNPALPVGIRLLPIETRRNTTTTLTHWRVKPQSWVQFPFSPKNPEHMAQTIAKLGELQLMTTAEAQELGFWLPDLPNGDRHPDNPIADRQGRVEVPVWRHAIINVPHPLLAQGLVILDTPGLNAVGVEPDLTMQLLGQSQATLFVLGADTGVTRSDLALWREHLSHATAAHIPRYAILNKIDTMWDELKSEAQIEAEIEKQCTDSAQLLSIGREAVIAISAQKGLLAKIQNDAALLRRSNLPRLEEILGYGLVQQRQTIIQQNCVSGMLRLQHRAGRTLEKRYREVMEEKAQLQALAGKNQESLHHIVKRMNAQVLEIERARRDFGAIEEAARVGIASALSHISVAKLREIIDELGTTVEHSVLKMGLKEPYEGTFAKLNFELQSCETLLLRVYGEVAQKTKHVNTLHGFAVAISPLPAFTTFADKLLNIRLTHIHYLEFGASWRLLSASHLRRVLQTLNVQVRMVFESAQAAIEQWAQELAQVFTVEIKERKESLARRQASVHEASASKETLMRRIAACHAESESIRLQSRRLIMLIKGMDSQAMVQRQMGLN